MKVNCQNCNKSFDKQQAQIKKTNNNNFCSRSCSAAYNNTRYPRKKLKPLAITVKKYSSCKKCGKDLNYKKRRMLCSICKNTNCENKTLAQVAYDKHHKSSCWALVRSRARAIMKNKPQVCSKCGYDKHVEVAHIKSIQSFDLNVLVSEVNNESNLILLCPNCHWEYDHNI
jgi:predicted HNH restriction endonuclease